jgi:hypothetical protein
VGLVAGGRVGGGGGAGEGAEHARQEAMRQAAVVTEAAAKVAGAREEVAKAEAERVAVERAAAARQETEQLRLLTEQHIARTGEQLRQAQVRAGERSATTSPRLTLSPRYPGSAPAELRLSPSRSPRSSTHGAEGWGARGEGAAGELWQL